MKAQAPQLTTAQLEAIGQAVYGATWIEPLAKELDYSPSTVWRWSNGKTSPIPRKACKEIRAFAKRKKVAFACE